MTLTVRSWIFRASSAIAATAMANSLIVQGAPQAQASEAGAIEPPLSGLQIKNAIDLNQLRPGTIKSLGGYTINPASIKLLSQQQTEQARKIRNLGNLAKVLQENATISEAGDGVLIQTQLSYSVQFGACLTKKSTLAAAGINCRNTGDINQSIRALSDPSSKRYIRNAADRQKAIENLSKANSTFTDLGAKLRLNLAKPEAAAKIGGSTVANLTQLSNAQLGNEILNAGTVDVQQAIYIPSANTLIQGLNKVKRLEGNSIDNLMRLKTSMQPEPSSSSHTTRPVNAQANAAEIDPGTTQDVLLASLPGGAPLLASNNSSGQGKEDVFLAGFTFGKQYEWKKRVGTTIDICWPFDCNRKLYVEPYAKFAYGLGLRFPIRTTTTYSPAGNNGRVTVDMEPFNGGTADYQRAGLSGNQLFDGQELVAEIGGEAGVRYNIYVDSGNPHVSIGYDLTEKLPRGLRNGQFTPPSPQRPMADVSPMFIEDIDLLGGSFNYGVVYAKVHPGIKADITSRELSFKLVDNYGSGSPQRVSNGQTKQVATRNGKASVTLKDPKYNIAVAITPGVRAKIGVDVVVWEDDWHYDIWIPELSITLPPAGADFSCHAQTTCSRTYEFLANGNSTSTGDSGSGSGGGSGSNASGSSGSGSGGPSVACSASNKLGRFALRSELTGRYVRGGVTADGTNTAVGAQATAAGGSQSWESFDVYDMGNRAGLNGNTLAFRSALKPSRWISVADNDSLQLAPGACTSALPSKLFIANRIGNTLQLQSLKNRQWIIQRSNGNLYANAATLGGNVPKALQFTLIPVAASDAQPSETGNTSGQTGTGSQGSGASGWGNSRPPAQSPAQPPSQPPAQRPVTRLDGWWQGNRGGAYSIQTSGDSLEMKGHDSNGAPINLFRGTINGNRISGRWQNICDWRTGASVLELRNGTLIRVEGNSSNSSWTPSQRPSTVQQQPNCNQGSTRPTPQAEINNLSGRWHANDGGTYILRQSGNSLSWRGRGGNFRNTFNGQITGTSIRGYWQDTSNSQTQNSGQLNLRIESGNRLVRVSHTGAFTGSVWEKDQP